MASLAEQIKNLSCPEPTNFDPEEDDFDITRATLIEKDKDHDLDDQDTDSSALRKKNISLLSDEDQKYHGRRVSRMDVAKMRGDFMDSDESVDELEYGDDSDQEPPEESTVLENQKDEEGHQEKDTDDGDDDNHDQDSVYSDDDNEEDDDDNEEDDDGNEKDDDEEDDDENEDDDEDDDGDVLSSRLGDNEEQDTGINSFSASKIGEEIEKGAAVKHQLNLWDTFLEYRIRLQKTMVLANKLPQCDVSDEFMNTSNGNQKPETLQGKKALSDLLYKLLIIQEKLLDQNPETRKALYPGLKTGNNNKESDDEEIPSDSENENEKDEQEDEKTGTDEEHSLKLPLKRKAGFTQEEFCECITKRHAAFQDVRDSVISKWSEKTRLASGTLSSKSFSAFDKSALTQIKQVLNDKPRLIKRTQLKRSSYRVLGKCEKEKQSVDPEPEEEADAHLKDYDTEIFDDDDFYHQLLRELIERRTTTNSDNPIEMGRQWLELQKLRRKIKKKVDTKASKGRKLRYNVHGKLASYMPPIDRGSMPDSSRNELFSSVFGQSKVQTEACDIDVFR